MSSAAPFRVLQSSAGDSARAAWSRELRIQVAGSRTTVPGYDALVSVDGVTQIAANGKLRGATPSDLEGAYVRVWFRGIPQSAGPTHTTAVARFVAIDSVSRGKP